MKRILPYLILILVIISSCGKKNESSTEKAVANQPTESNPKQIKPQQTIEQLEGKAFFSKIKDTIDIEHITSTMLIESKWVFEPFENCRSILTFKQDWTGSNYGCEIEEEYDTKYVIKDDTLFIEVYDKPHVDNPEMKRIKYRDDVYVYTGTSIIMVGSKMYNVSGRSWIPKIKTVIEYKQIAIETFKTEPSEQVYGFKDFDQLSLNDFIVADLNGDNILDSAKFEIRNQKGGIIIIDGETLEEFIIGCGTEFNEMGDDFRWVDYWGVTRDNETYEIIVKDGEIVGEQNVLLDYPSIFVRKKEVGGGIITYKNGKYKWVHQSD